VGNATLWLDEQSLTAAGKGIVSGKLKIHMVATTNRPGAKAIDVPPEVIARTRELRVQGVAWKIIEKELGYSRHLLARRL